MPSHSVSLKPARRMDARGIGKFGVIALIIIAAVIALVFIPIPGYSNVRVTTTLGETCVIACSYSVQSVSGTVTGSSTFIDLGAWFTLGVAPPCIDCQYKVTASLSNGQSASASETKFVSNLFNVNYQDTLTMSIAYVPVGSYTVTVSITLQGSVVATGTGSLMVP